MEKRIGAIAIIVENPAAVQFQLSKTISDAGSIILGRMGIPDRERNLGILALIVEGTEDEINTLTGKLGGLHGVKVRAALAKK
ncbi:MAG: TM1266 family iron-only hydrogenase system putative regulator [Bacillota bacterium]